MKTISPSQEDIEIEVLPADVPSFCVRTAISPRQGETECILHKASILGTNINLI